MKRITKRTLAVSAIVGSALAVSTGAFAFFTATTSIVANGKTDTVEAVTAQNAQVGTLRPGSCEDVTFDLVNGNDFPVNGIYLVNSVGVRADADTASHLHLATYLRAGTGAAELVANGYEFKQIQPGTSQTVTFKNAVCMDVYAPDSAQGQAVAVDLNVSLKQANGTEYPPVN